jgi:N-acetylmuramoyl-L-alanine amidase
MPLSISLLSLLAAAGCGKSTGSRKPLPFGVMDEPRNGEAVHGIIPVRGWALSESGIAQVLVYVDRKYATPATLGADRPDVAKAFPAFANHPDSGWLASLDTSKLPPGTHEIVVQGTAENGATRDLGDINVTVVKP